MADVGDKRAGRPFGRRSALLVTLGLILSLGAAGALAAGLVIWFATAPKQHATYETAAGQRRTITLTDGSELTLAPASRITIGATPRDITLEGEAFFAVTSFQFTNARGLSRHGRFRIRPEEGTVYPAPLATVPSIRFEGAGFPDYPWMFATDQEYTMFALLAAGQFGTAEDGLRSLARVSMIANHDSGKVVHETVTDGSVYFGLNDERGDIDETAALEPVTVGNGD